MSCQRLDSPSGLTIFYKGPSVEHGPLPALFYFALSGSESLELDPYNQPVKCLENAPIRIFSFSLPGHNLGDDHRLGMQRWAESLLESHNYLENFYTLAIKNIDYLISQGLVDRRFIATGGLSRGGFVATHLAARHSDINTVIGFSPLTALKPLHEYTQVDANFLYRLNLERLIPKLAHKAIRYYIGNHDMRVGTKTCFDFVQKLTEAAFEKGIRSPQIEMIIYPSIGHKGHGTPPYIFEAGTNWIKQILNLGA